MLRIKSKLVFTILTWVLLSAQSLGANVVWVGAALDVAQVDTITIAGTWAATDTLTVTCNNKAVTITMGTTIDTIEEVASAVGEILVSNSHDPSDITADVTTNIGGYEYGEFRDIQVSVSGAVITIMSAVAGTPFTITVAETATGTATHSAAATAATGKHHFDNVKNWSTGSLPAEGDTIIFPVGSVGVWYALDNTIEDLRLQRLNGYTADIGLPTTNTVHGGFSYPEYRSTHLALPGRAAAVSSQIHEIGEVNSSFIAQGKTRLDLGTITPGIGIDVLIYDAATIQDNEHAVSIVGGKTVGITCYKGSVDIASDATANTTELTGVNVYYSSSKTTDSNVSVGKYATFTAAGLLNQTGGLLFVEATLNLCDLEMFGGRATVNTPFSGSDKWDTVNIRAGATLVPIAGQFDSLFVYEGGTVEADAKGSTAVVCTATTFYRGFIYNDPQSRITHISGIDFVGCTPQDGTFNVKASQTWTPSAL